MTMNWRACVVAALVFSGGCAASAQLADETAVPRFSVAELKKALDAGQALVIDVRDSRSFADGHLPGAVNVPLDQIPQKLAQLKGSRKVIVAYCA
jgi:3-mercaptopyruvate sulfurtransferase SseA